MQARRKRAPLGSVAATVWVGWAALLSLAIGSQQLRTAHGQLSDPIAHDGNMDVASNKFLSRAAEQDTQDEGVDDEEPVVGNGDTCPQNFELKWMTEVSSSVYSTPLIADLYSDGKKEIILNSFVHYVESLEGEDGAHSPGYPVYHQSSVHASPLLADVDYDGVQEVVVATYNGEVFFFKDSGVKLDMKLAIPRLKVRKDWYAGLLPDHVDHTKPDIPDAYEGEQLIEEEPDIMEQALKQERPDLPPVPPPESPGARRRRLLQESAMQGDELPATAELPDQLSEEAAESFQSLDEYGGNPYDPDGKHPYVDEEYEARYRRMYDEDEFWDAEEFGTKEHPKDEQYIYVDAHVLCTPVVVDLDNDGNLDLVMAVSYFYDREYYDNWEHHHELGEDVDVAKYIAGGIVVYDLVTKDLKWSTHLDLSTDQTTFRAYMYSAPSVADLDGDGNLEVVVGTSVGFIYALNGHDGTNRKGFPIQMGEIQGQVVIADVNDDGFPEIVACDTRGNIGVFNWRGREVWERHLRSLISQGVTVGDVNGDGQTEVVVGTSSGYVHVLSGTTGAAAMSRVKVTSTLYKQHHPFPFRTHGRIMAPVLITRLHDNLPQQHMVVVSFDGFLYIIDGATGCADTIDIGETSYAMVLADDLDSNGRLDIVVSTMNGNVYCFETPAVYHPMKAWPQQVQAFNGLVARHNWVGVAATPATRALGDVGGETFLVQFEVVDNRPLSNKPLEPMRDDPSTIRSPYVVTVTLKLPGQRAVASAEYATPGTYALSLPCPRGRLRATVEIFMVDSRKMSFVDTFPVSFHLQGHRMLKWLMALPFMGMAIAALSLQDRLRSGTPMPT